MHLLGFHNVHHPLLDVHDQLTAHGFDVFVLWRFGSPAGWNLRKHHFVATGIATGLRAEGWNAKGGRYWKYDFHQALLPNDPPKQGLHVRLEMSLCLTWTVKISALLHVPTPDIPESVEKCLAANVNPSELGVFQHESPQGNRKESLDSWKWQRDAMFMPTTFHLSTRISWTNFNGTIASKKTQISNRYIWSIYWFNTFFLTVPYQSTALHIQAMQETTVAIRNSSGLQVWFHKIWKPLRVSKKKVKNQQKLGKPARMAWLRKVL